MSKERRLKLLQELQELEDEKVETLEEPVKIDAMPNISPPTINDSIDGAVQAQKKPRTPKQLEAFERAKAIRDANYAKRKQEADLKAEQERKILEEKLVKKAIAVKKKQIKKQQLLDEISSDDDTKPIQKSREPVNASPVVAIPPTPKFVFF